MSSPPPACPWCGAPTVPAGRRLLGCTECGVATTFPVPGAGELEGAYAGSYRPSAGRFGFGADRLLARTRGALAARIDAVAPAGPVLDVGSGDGSLLNALAARGRTAVGLERDAAARRPGLDLDLDPRLTVLATELTDFDDRRGEWAAIIMWHSLEHLADAPAALDHAAGLLAPGGVLMIAAPNRDSWQARALGDRWLALDLPRHLTHLTARALVARLRRDGLEVERVSHWRGGQVLFGWLHGLVISLPGHLDLYDAIRRPAARAAAVSPLRRTLTLVAGVGLAPLAALLSGAEVLAGRGGTVFVQAWAPPEHELLPHQPTDSWSHPARA